MENNVLNALIAYIAEAKDSKEKLFTIKKEEIRTTWKTFFELIHSNEDNEKTILRDIKKYYDDEKGSFDFKREETISTATYETFIKSLLLSIDNHVYSLNDEDFLLKGRKKLKLAEMIDDIRIRAQYSTKKDLEKYCNFLDTGREARNKRAHGYSHDGAVFQQFIEAFFVATFVFTEIQNIWAGLKVMQDSYLTSDKPTMNFASLTVEKEGSKEPFCKILNAYFYNDNAIKIFVKNDVFGDEEEIKLIVRTYRFDTQKESKVITLKRGEFYKDKSENTDRFKIKKTPDDKKNQKEIELLQRENAKQKKTIDNLTEKNACLSKEKDELKELLRQQANSVPMVASTNSPSSGVVGIVHIKNTKTDAQCYLRINEGTNTYGTDADNGNHHQILLGLRGIDIKPKQFEIGQRDDRFFIRDLSNGGTLVNEQPIDPKGAYVTENTTVRVANNLEIHISKI